MSLYDNIPKSDLNKIIRYPFTNYDLFYNYHHKQPYDTLRKEDNKIVKQVLCDKKFSLLDNLSKQALLFLKTIIKFKQINNYFSYILSIYIKNEKIPYINNLIGAFHFVEMKYKDKHFYLIGEHHKDDANCNYKKGDILIPDLIELIIRTTPKVIDLFIERRMDEKKSKDIKNYLRATYNKFEKCVRKVCIHKNLRIHNVDIRSRSRDSLPHILYLYTKEKIKNRDVYHLEEIIEENKKEITRLLKDGNSIKQEINDSIEFHDKILKQGENIQDKKIKDKIQKFITKLQNEHSYNKITYTQLLSNNSSIIKKLKLFLSNYRVSFMDLYCLSRIFRSFKQVKNKPSNDPQNIIIHAGDGHIRNYQQFLLEIGGKVIYEQHNKDIHNYNCVNIKNVKQPFFK